MLPSNGAVNERYICLQWTVLTCFIIFN